MKVLYIGSSNIANFSENSNSFQQPYNLCKNADCTLLVPETVTLKEEVMVGAKRILTFSSIEKFPLKLSSKVGAFLLQHSLSTSSFDCIVSDFSEWSVKLAEKIAMKLEIPWFFILWDPPFSNRYDINSGIRFKIERKIRLYLYNQLIKKSKGCFCFINAQVVKHEQLMVKKCFQLTNGVDLNRLDHLTTEKSPFSMCNIGRVRYDKGCKELLDSFEKIGDTYPNSTLTFIGQIDGPEEEQQIIKELIRNHKYGTNITVTGRIPFLDAMKIVAQKQVGLHAYSDSNYLRYNHVLKVGEYQALGTVPIAIKYPGTADIIDDNKNGLLIESNKPEVIADAVLTLFSDQERLTEISQRAKSDIQKRSWKLVTRKMYEIIESELS